MLDIGANVGAHTLRLARRVGKAGRVFAFEPTEFAFRKLLRNLALNDLPQVTPVQVALAARNRPGQHVDFRASWRTDGGRHDGPTVVDLVRLDDWWAVSGSGKPELVKIDVDGNEFGVLTGGRDLLAGSLPILVMEAVGPHFYGSTENPFAFLRDLGYQFANARTGQPYAHLDEMKRLFPPEDRAMAVSINVVAAPRSDV